MSATRLAMVSLLAAVGASAALIGGSAEAGDVLIVSGSDPQPDDTLLPFLVDTSPPTPNDDGTPLEGLLLSEGALETLYPGGPVSIQTEGVIRFNIRTDLNPFGVGRRFDDDILLFPNTDGEIRFEGSSVRTALQPSSPLQVIQTRGASFVIQSTSTGTSGNAIGLTPVAIRTNDAGDRNGGDVRLATSDSPSGTTVTLRVGSINTDGGFDADASGGNRAGNVSILGPANSSSDLTVQFSLGAISARGGDPGVGSLRAGGDGGFVEIRSTPFTDAGVGLRRFLGNISVNGGAQGGRPGSVAIDGGVELPEFMRITADAPDAGFISADRGNVVFGGEVRDDIERGAGIGASEEQVSNSTLSIDALGEIVFRENVGFSSPFPSPFHSAPLEQLQVSDATEVRFEKGVRSEGFRVVKPVGDVRFLGGFGRRSQIGLVSISPSAPVSGSMDFFAAVEVDEVRIHADTIRIGGTDGAYSDDGALTVGGGTIGGRVLVGGDRFGTLRVDGGTLDLLGPVVVSEGGTIKNDGGTIQFQDTLTNGGAFISDPADNFFTDLILKETGYLVGGEGDRFFVAGDLLSSSEASVLWNTREAALVFEAGEAKASHRFAVGGEDRGATAEGFVRNFAWGSLQLAVGESLVLKDGFEKGGALKDGFEKGGALYVRDFILGGGLDQLGEIELAEGLRIYYDRRREGNRYLAGLDYKLAGGGSLVASVPEPGITALLAFQLLAIVWMRRPGSLSRRQSL